HLSIFFNSKHSNVTLICASSSTNTFISIKHPPRVHLVSKTSAQLLSAAMVLSLTYLYSGEIGNNKIYPFTG
ncbi:MAG: hypothetical protein K2P61_02280, partial [Burkholderiaceae bacterium]|nr:hypothetical protein [Burkholderiaceae bacterium]